MIKKIFKIIILFFLVILMFLIIQNEYTAFKYNKGYTDPILNNVDQNELLEVIRLKESIGDQLWPGFKEADIPIIFFNNKYEFLYSKNEINSNFDLITDNIFSNGFIYRTEAVNSKAFAVLVEDKWAGSIGTLETINKEYFLGIRGELPPLIRSLFPYQLAKINRDMHVSATLHEMFHAYQATMNSERFNHIDSSYINYPLNNQETNELWNKEGYYLNLALNSNDVDTIKNCLKNFFEVRDNRREYISQTEIIFEKQYEWLEGTAKYVEIKSYELASEIEKSPYNINYKNDVSYWNMEFKRLSELGSLDDFRFYISGMAQGRILDKLNIEWKNKMFDNDVYLEDLLRDYLRSDNLA